MARSTVRWAVAGAVLMALATASAWVGGIGPAGATGARVAWRAVAAPQPAGAGAKHQEAVLTSVACAKGTCVAGGHSLDGAGVQQAEVLVRSGGKWGAGEASLPTGSTDATVSALSCAKSGECVGVGSYVAPGAGIAPLLLVGTGGRWTVPTIAGATSGSAGLDAVACSPRLGCVAVGSGIVVDEVAGTWTATSVPAPVGFHGTPGPPAAPRLLAVSCAKTCTAVGTSFLGGDPSDYGQGAVIVRGSGTKWTDRAAPLPPDALAYTDAEVATLSSIACSGTTCVAVGTYEVSSSPVVDEGLLVSRSGTSWTATRAPQPSGSASTLSGVACLSSTTCVAVGGFTDASSVGQNLVLDGAGSSWTAGAPPFPVDGTSSQGLNAVSCGSADFCAATGTYEGATGAEAELLAGSTTSWVATAAPLPKGTIGASLTAVHCSKTSCLAAGDAVLGSHPSTKGLFESY